MCSYCNIHYKKLPIPILKYKSPHKVLRGFLPSYSSLRVFGCLCFAKNMNIQHKFDERSKPGIFVGFPFNKKGYRIYDMKTRQIYVSRDVQFHEVVFPYQDLQSPPFNNSISINTQILDYKFDDTPSTLATQTNSPPRNSHNDNLNDSIVTISSSQDDTSFNLPPISIETLPNNPPTELYPSNHRHSQRICTSSVRLKDYVTKINIVTSKFKFPLKNYLSFFNLSNSR